MFTGERAMPEPEQVANWFKSSLSASGQCVEVRRRDLEVQVRDSKDPSGPVLTFTPAEWAAFTGGVRLGEFDLNP
jgi:hypothetical protein